MKGAKEWNRKLWECANIHAFDSLVRAIQADAIRECVRFCEARAKEDDTAEWAPSWMAQRLTQHGVELLDKDKEKQHG